MQHIKQHGDGKKHIIKAFFSYRSYGLFCSWEITWFSNGPGHATHTHGKWWKSTWNNKPHSRREKKNLNQSQTNSQLHTSIAHFPWHFFGFSEYIAKVLIRSEDCSRIQKYAAHNTFSHKVDHLKIW